MNELLKMPVREMAARIRKGELSPVELLEVHLRRIEEVNPKINAIIDPHFEEAKAEARKAEEKLAKSRENLPPLFGVPCTIKDTHAVKGMKWTGGVWSRRDVVAEEDATTVKRVRDAGAIIMGKTNIPEAAMWCETYNSIYGRTKNPYDLSRGVGGSSGGEGAIIAAGASPFGLGADIGGSIRYPSAFNGIAGHKPTATWVPQTGHWPPAEGNLGRYNCLGPMCRRVEDLALIMPLLIGPDGKDKWAQDKPWTGPETVDLKKVKVHFYDYNGFIQCDADVKRAVNMAAGALAGQGIEVENWMPEGIGQGVGIWQAALSENPDSMAAIIGNGEEIPLGREFIRFVTGKSKVTFPALGAALIEKPGQIMRGRNQQTLELAWKMQADIERKLGDNGVIVCPVFPHPAPKHTWIWASVLGISYSCIYNVLQFPSTIIPINHLPGNNLPVSVQVVSSRFHDHLTLAVAKRLEETFGGWFPPESVGN